MKTHMSNTSTHPPEWWCLNISELAPNTLFSSCCYSILHQGAVHKYILQKWQYTTGHHFFTVNHDWWSPLQITQPDIHSFLFSFTQLMNLDAQEVLILFMSPFIHCMLLTCKNSHWYNFSTVPCSVNKYSLCDIRISSKYTCILTDTSIKYLWVVIMFCPVDIKLPYLYT